MGKQVLLFIIGKDEIDFYKVIKGSGDCIINKKGEQISMKENSEAIRDPFEKSKLLPFGDLYIINPNSKIIMSPTGFVDPIFSDVIEIMRCQIHNDAVDNGRIWAEFKYLDSKGETIIKPEWFLKRYNFYRNWIIKNLRTSKGRSPHFYIGEIAYRMNKEQGYRMMNGPIVEIEFA